MYVMTAERAAEPERSAKLREARQACAAAIKQSKHVQDDGVPEALRLQGVYQWLVGNRAAAERLWERSIEAAERLGARHALAVTYLERGKRLERQSDLDRAAAILDQIRAEARAQGVAS